MTRQELDRLWAEPANWRLVYRCARDPRAIVPRRRRWKGWTINFAHPLAWPVLLACIAVAVGPFIALLMLGVASVSLLIVVLVASIGSLMAISHWESTRSR